MNSKRKWMPGLLSFPGRITAVDFNEVDRDGDFILYIDFVAEFENFEAMGTLAGQLVLLKIDGTPV